MNYGIPKNIDREHVLLAIQDLDGGFEHSFGKPTGYLLIHEGKVYAPKTVIGIANRHPNGVVLHHTKFSSGTGKGQAVGYLRRLGFEVVSISGGDSDVTSEVNETDLSQGKPEAIAGIEDNRKRSLANIVVRQGQSRFRSELLEAYDGRCAVTNCDAPEALEAAHIFWYSGPESNPVSNGMLLRADIHTLFDLDLLQINPNTLRVSLHSSLLGAHYSELDGRKIRCPQEAEHHPDPEALRFRWNRVKES